MVVGGDGIEACLEMKWLSRPRGYRVLRDGVLGYEKVAIDDDDRQEDKGLIGRTTESESGQADKV